MDQAKKSITILHFNDVYNIEEGEREPVGGIARFKTALEQHSTENTLVLFSGDLFSPSTLSSVTRGDHMILPINEFGVDVACIGNHDFDNGLAKLSELMKQCKFPWLLANVHDPDTNTPFGGCQEYYILEKFGYKFGFVGLAEHEWLVVLPLPSSHLQYEDFVECGKRYNKFLREEKGCDFVIALTHMRNYNDKKLAEAFDGFDLILGGHDHVRWIECINGTYCIKSGSEFKEFTKITLSPISKDDIASLPEDQKEKVYKDKFLIDIESVEVTSKYEPNPLLQEHIDSYKKIFEAKLGVEVGYTEVDFETTFSKIRTSEQNSTVFLSDVIRAFAETEIMLLNAGAIRSDCLFPKGYLRLKDLMAMIPHPDLLRKVKLTGKQVYQALENAVSKYPIYEGRFCVCSGLTFAFDPKKEPMNRVPLESIYVKGRGPLKLDEEYTVAIKNFLAGGKDGYDVFTKGEFLNDEATATPMNECIFEFFDSINRPEVLEALVAKGFKISNFEGIDETKRHHGLKPSIVKAIVDLVYDVKEKDGKRFISINPKIEGRVTIL